MRTVVREEEVVRRVGTLWAGLYRLAVELGYRWDGGRWVSPSEAEVSEDGCGVACGAGAGPGSPGAPVPAPSGPTVMVPVSHGAPKLVTSFRDNTQTRRPPNTNL